MNLVPLFEEALEFQDYNGTVLSDGKVAVYYIGRTRLADIYTDVEGSVPAENPRILNNLGMGPVYVNPAFDYEMVVFDTYGSELFSVKKYLASKGEHSTANVVVTPSESIAVSAWTVGDVQVYMPYLTGQLGKVYTGIDPIVVNNTEDKISANHIPLGVQDPLYFVEDSETACIIGCSAQTEIPAELSGKWDEASDAVIANSAQWAEGTEYEAGSYVDIDGHTISVTGLQPEGDYAYNSALSSKLDVTATGQFLTGLPDDLVYTADITGLATTAQLDEKLDKSDSGNFYPMEGNPSGFLTAHQSLQGYATEQWVEDKGYLTGVEIPESAGWNATTQTVSANSAQWAGGTANPQIPVTGINGIKISESGDKVVFEVSGDYVTHDDLSNYYTTAEANSLSSMLSGAIDYVSANAGSESNVITDNGEFTVLPNTLGTNVTIKYPLDVPAYDEPSAVPFHDGEWFDWSGNSGADPNNNGSNLGMILHYSDTTPINLAGEQIQVTLPHTISGVNKMCLYYLNPGFSAPVAGPNASNYITSNTNTYSAGKYVFTCVGNPYSAGTGTFGCYLGLGFNRAAAVYGPSSIGAVFDTVEYGPATGYEVNLNRYFPTGDPYIGVGVNSATKQTIISATYSLTGQLNRIYPTYTAVTANSATWNSVSSKADKNSLLDLKSDFISDNGTYILHVPSACDVIGTQLSSYDIVVGTKTTNVSLTANEINWQRPWSGYASFNMNTTTATVTFSSEYGPVDFILLDSNNNVVCSSYQDHDSATFTTALTGLNTGTYIAKIESPTEAYIYSDYTLIAVSGEEIETNTYSGLFIGGGVPQSAFDELKQSYDALSALFAQYSGQWLLPNEGEE